jgi:amino acid adenylation domain-containing protein
MNTAIRFQDVQGMLPPSPTQEAMLFHSRDESSLGTYVGQMSCTVHGDLDLDALRRAWTLLTGRHAALRTAFLVEDVERPVQVVYRTASLDWRVEDLRGLREDARDECVRRFLEEDRQRPFYLHRPPLMRFRLFRLRDDATCFVWTRHHAILDGWSVGILLEELRSLYEAEVSGEASQLPAAVPFQVYLDRLGRPSGEDAATFWGGQLAGFRQPTFLSSTVSLARGRAPSDSLREERTRLDAGLGRQIRAFARHTGVTLASVLTGAWALVLRRYCDSNDVLMGMTFAGRPADLDGVESIVGLFLNTLPIRVQAPPQKPLGRWLQELHQRLADAGRHQHAPLVGLRRHADVPPDLPLFDHILVLENYPGVNGEGPMSFADHPVTDYRFIDQTEFPLNVGVAPGDPMVMVVAYDPAHFARTFITRLMANYQTALASLVAASEETSLALVEAISAAERIHLIEKLNDTDVAWERIASRTAAAPEAEAVRFGDRSLNYQQLESASNHLAHRLVDRGVGPEVIVGLCLHRSLELVTGMLAVMKAGGAYLPLDPDEPAERLAFMVKDSAVKHVLAMSDQAGLFESLGVTVLSVPQETGDADPERPARATGLRPDNAAYVIYTSGSTGRPKAVVNTHGGLLNRLLWMQSAYPIGSGDRVLQKTPYTFDVSVWEFFWPLITGATIVLAEPGGHRDPDYLRDVIVREGITVMHFVPSMLQEFLGVEGVGSCTSLRHVFCSGEALSAPLRDFALRRIGAALHNLYGPTEAAIDVTFEDFQRTDDAAVVPIGRPISNTQILLLDDDLQPTPHGAVGGIYIGGAGLARGYLGRPDLTAARFLPHPFSNTPGARIYRTGDLARLDEGGRIVFLGRSDHQVKIRGLRVELGEIETALRTCRGVSDSAVLAPPGDSGRGHLVGHVVLDGEVPSGAAAAERAQAIRDEMRARLPSHMIPDRFVFHAVFPLSPNGKLDRKALRELEGDGAAARRRIDPPRTPVEDQLVSIWKEVLDLPEVGIRDSFFELGGHSLLVTRVRTHIQRAFGVTLAIRDLFDAQTIEELTERILWRQIEEEDPASIAELIDEIRGITPGEAEAIRGGQDGASGVAGEWVPASPDDVLARASGPGPGRVTRRPVDGPEESP